jgi:plasmid maintenance system killer protein
MLTASTYTSSKEIDDEEWAISVSGNWRITFRFAKGEVFDVSLEDYH